MINYMKDFLHTFITKRNMACLLANIGSIPIMTLVSSFLAINYVNILGMDEYSIGIMFPVASIFDLINDPIIIRFIDRAKSSKLSKFKRVLILGTPIYLAPS